MDDEKKIRVLLVEDDPGDAYYLEDILSRQSTQFLPIVRVENLGLALERLEGGGFDLILLDLALPDSLGLDTFSKVYSHSPRVPIIVLTGLDDSDIALKAVSEGAQDYVVKGDFSGRLLEKAIRYAIERQKLILKLQEALEKIKVLSGMLPMCSNCRKIRNDQGYWDTVEQYVTAHADVQFSHSICPDCLRALYPDFADEILDAAKKRK